MSRIRGLELLFNLEKTNLKSREDCVVAAIHCLLINENVQCVGIGDKWPESNSSTTELLPKDWNSNQDVYSLRYTTKDNKSRFLLKITKMEHMLQVDVVMNEDTVANISVPVANYIADDYTDYSTAYKDLESLSESFKKDVMQNFQPKPVNVSSSTSQKNTTDPSPAPARPLRHPTNPLHERDPYRFGFPRVGGSDLNPFSFGGGGMLMDPSSFGVPSRPTLPQFGVGGPRGFLPRGAVPPGARFDPFMPPIMPTNRFDPDPDHFRPPDFDDFM